MSELVFNAVPVEVCAADDDSWRLNEDVVRAQLPPEPPFLKQLGDQFGALLMDAAPILTTAHKAKIAELYSTINYNLTRVEAGDMNIQLGVALVTASIDAADLPSALDSSKEVIKTAIVAKYLG